MKPKKLTVVVVLGAVSMLSLAPEYVHSRERSVREEISFLQRQINALRNQLAGSKLEMVFRDQARTLVFAPGQTEAGGLGLPSRRSCRGGWL